MLHHGIYLALNDVCEFTIAVQIASSDIADDSDKPAKNAESRCLPKVTKNISLSDILFQFQISVYVFKIAYFQDSARSLNNWKLY